MLRLQCFLLNNNIIFILRINIIVLNKVTYFAERNDQIIKNIFIVIYKVNHLFFSDDKLYLAEIYMSTK